MCIILLSYKQHKQFPVIIAANRDEFYERPTAPADYWEDYPEIYAGRDLVSGGTWMGVTKSGRFAAVTNYRDPRQKRGKVSRGNLVADFLKGSMPAREYMKHVEKEGGAYTGFNLIAGQGEEIVYYSNRGGSPIELATGIYGISNHLLDTPWPKISSGKNALAKLIDNESLAEDDLFGILQNKTIAKDDDLPDTGVGVERERILSPIFIKTPIYGTRCSTVLTIDSGSTPRLTEQNWV